MAPVDVGARDCMVSEPADVAWPSGGEMGTLIGSWDWADSPLGPIETWPQSLRTLVDLMLGAAHPAYIAWGPDHTSLYNDAYIPILGTKHPAALGRPFAEVWSEIWDEFRPIVAATMAGQAHYSQDRAVPLAGRKNRPVSWFTYSWTPVRDESGHVAGFYCSATETTDHVLLEESRLRLAVDVAELGTWSWNLVTGEGELDDRAAEIAGLPTGIIPDFWERLRGSVHPDDRASLQAAMDQGLAENGSFSLDYRTVTPTGSIRYVAARARVFTDDTGSPAHVVGTIRDATAEREAEASLRAARDESEHWRQLYETVTATTPDLIYIFDRNHRFTYANEALLEMWGKTWDEAIGKGLLELGYEPWHAEMHEREIDEIIATRQRIRGEVSFPHAKHGPRIYDYILAPLINADGEVEAIAGTTRDITELRELARQKDEFIGIASHELKTPVTSIKAYAQLLHRHLSRAGDTASADLVARMDAQINRLSELIHDLLDVSRIEAGEIQFNFQTFDLDQLVDDVIAELGPTLSGRQVIRDGHAKARACADRERTGQVLTNLLTNAIKYSPPTEPVIVHAASDADQITVGVQDFGVGIAPEDHLRVFDRFYRAGGPERDTFPGLGLGLFISAEIIRRQRGRIWVESVPGEGSIFRFTLPIVNDDADFGATSGDPVS
jgi:PAS domain S-box-containing protein